MRSSRAMRRQAWGFAMPPDPVSNGAFVQALLAPDLPSPQGLTGRDGVSPTRRFAVYRNNVTVSLIDALASIFPTVQNLVGKDFFRAMARLYVTAHPPTSPLLFTYGESFPVFLEGFTPAADLPFLADVARIERLWLDAFHAADAAPLDPATLAQIPAEDLANVRFQPHPATRIARLNHAAGTIIRNDRAGISLDGVNPMTPEAVLVTRPAFDVAVEILPEGGASVLETLLAGGTLGQAFAVAEPEGADIPVLLGLALGAGAFTSINTPQESGRS